MADAGPGADLAGVLVPVGNLGEMLIHRES